MNEKWNDLETITANTVKRTSPFISISNNGVITFNSGFLNQPSFDVTQSTHVIYSYSKEEDAIVFEFTDDKSVAGARKMCGKGGVISGRALFSTYKMDLSAIAGRYEPSYEDVGEKGMCWVLRFAQKIQTQRR